jgi:hypothetical protein
MPSLSSALMRASTATASALLAGLVFASCGGDDEPERLRGPAKEVAGVVRALERSVAAGDWRKICRDLFSEQVRRQAGGRECPAMLRRTAGGVRRPRIAVRRIEVEGNRARAEVTTRARGEGARNETIQLAREAGAFRISSLSR